MHATTEGGDHRFLLYCYIYIYIYIWRIPPLLSELQRYMLCNKSTKKKGRNKLAKLFCALRCKAGLTVMRLKRFEVKKTPIEVIST